jgi:elongation factor P
MVHVLCIDEEPVQIQLPLRLPFKVMDTAPVGAASDSKDTSTDMKPARLENGTILNVPEFIHPGETILVNTEKGIFHSRAK